MSRNLATVVVRGVLPGLRRRRTGLLQIYGESMGYCHEENEKQETKKCR